MTGSQEEMLCQHLLQKVKDKIPQPQGVPTITGGRQRKKKPLASIQEASHQLLNIALQKPKDTVDQILSNMLDDGWFFT
jgi:hypothetical protein